MSRVLVGVSGGIAAYKVCELIRILVRDGHEVRAVATPNALRFVSGLTLQTLTGHPVRSDLFSPGEESEISHIELADWAELVIVAPATADCLARLAHGRADDLLATVCLATRAPLLLAPAMNVNMYRHPATQANLDTLAKRGARVVGPAAGELACGWEGEGRLVEVDALAAAAGQLLGGGALAGEVVLVTAGPTAEAVDPVRVITNRSSGKMGFAIAEEAARRGAEVVLVTGRVPLPTPFGVDRVDVESTAEMREAALAALPRATLVVAAAAVSDYRPAAPLDQKLKRGARETLQLELVRNPDILVELCRRKEGRLVVGFAAETERVLEHAARKLVEKGCDLIVANDVSRGDIGFDADRNEVTILGPEPDWAVPVPAASKREIAARILDRALEARAR